MRYTVGMSAPIFIRLTPEEDARLRELENNPLIHPKVRLRALEIRSGQRPLGWTAPPKGAAEFVGRGHSTVLSAAKQRLGAGLNEASRVWLMAAPALRAAAGAAPKITPEVEGFLT